MSKYNSFIVGGKNLPVHFEESLDILDGVVCDVYTFIDDDTKDLGVVHIKAGSKSPRQRVLGGKETLLGGISGTGKLVIERKGKISEHLFNGENSLNYRVEIDDIIQCFAGEDSDLLYYEVYWPPYQDGRYKDL